MEKLPFNPQDRNVKDAIVQLESQLKIDPHDLVKIEAGVSYVDKNETTLLMEIQSKKFSEIVLETHPETIYYQVSGRDDAGIWMHFSIPGNEFIEITTFTQPEGHLDSGIFNKVKGYKKVVIKESLLFENEEMGKYILEGQV